MARHYYGHATAAVFAPLEPRSRAGLVVRRLSDAIALGLLPDGSQLPGEADLAATLGVSTVTVREALAVLRHEGLLETRRGRGGGSFVRTPTDGVAVARQRLSDLSVVDLRDMGDLYATVSGGTAAIAARRCAPTDLAQVRKAATEFAQADTAGTRRSADARLRILLAVVAQSPRLYRAEVELQAEIGILLWLTLDDDDAHAHDADLVDRLVAALGDTDTDTARSLAERRVREATARLIDLRIKEEAW